MNEQNPKTQGFRGPDPSPLMQLSTAYWDAQVLLTANRLGLCDHLVGEGKTLDELVELLGLDARAARLFLNACGSLGLLELSEGRYRNTPVANAFLNAASPGYLGNAFRYSDDLYETWGKLEESVRTGDPALQEQSYLGEDESRTRNFVYGMHDRAVGIGRAMVELCDLNGRHSMLDVGGGPGTYSAIFTERFSGLSSQVLDLPEVVKIASEIIESLGASDRVSVLPGNYRDSSYPGDKDVVLISGVFHRENEGGCRELIAKAACSLEPGGMLLISDVFADQGGMSPSFAALFGLNMMLTAPDGCVHEDVSVAQWMQDAGFHSTEIKKFPPPMPHRLVIGVKA